jgi:putative restriction endonuclease
VLLSEQFTKHKSKAMKEGQKPWTEQELILAINLYCKLPFGKLHSRTPHIIELAKLIGRTPGSIAYKLVNFASLDPVQKERGIKGADNTSKLDKEVWDRFSSNWNELPYESEKLLAKFKKTSVEQLVGLREDELPKEGKIRQQMVRVRVNQYFFRAVILASYNNTCCITGLQKPELIIAGHIRPWGLDEENRLNPHNGLALNGLHDKAFEVGLITILPDYTIRVSSELRKEIKSAPIKEYFIRYNKAKIRLPSRFFPGKDFLKYHNDVRFKK